MLLILLAALLATSAPYVTPALPATALPAASAALRALSLNAYDEHLRRGTSAMESGDLEVARREFVVAAALARADGVKPHAAVHALARVLYGLDREREAARALDELAAESIAMRDFDGAAQALADALWLHVRAGRGDDAARDGRSLARLLENADLNPSVRRQLRSRFP